MEGSCDNRQPLPPTKKEPLRVRSFSSMRQHEQQQMAAAALRIPRGPGQHMPSLQLRDPRLKQHLAHPSVQGSSSSSSAVGNRSTVKFTPNVAVKQETGAGTTASPSTAQGATAFSVDALLLRSLHSHQPSPQGQDRSNRPKFPGTVMRHFSPAPAPKMQSSSLQNSSSSAKQQQQKKGSRSISLSGLALDQSQGHLFLPITIPFIHQTQKRMQQERLKQDTDKETFRSCSQPHQLDELQGIDTAASTPNHLRRSESTAAPPTNGKDSLQCFKQDSYADTPAALLLKDQFSTDGNGECWEEDSRPEFVHLCFPELLPSLDIAAMQAQQANGQNQTQQTAAEHQHRSSTTNTSTSSSNPVSSSRRNCPTPLHALPSGRIGKLLIRRSGRVHLCLLTDASRRRAARGRGEAAAAAEASGSATAEATPDSMKPKTEDKHRQAPPQTPYTLHSDDICYDVLVGTEGSFAQVRVSLTAS
ncbi:hypothetical protein, conserved [Eimeria acervulina]|uniref:Uncharacterized protein n=1 Tax=Eimeria acervulina TaxID=5801 RepID=U6GPR8_EIMAC|nr:hypothetical protein, conserved [Eimeria acervulina]CDI81273.1 hypothetical protein, conserved [Eimeria acervulina]